MKRSRLILAYAVAACMLLCSSCATVPHPPTPGMDRGAPQGAAAKAWDYYRVGDVAAPAPAPVTPGLLLVGGGDWPYSAYRWFFERAGGGHIVILRASYAGENGEEMYSRIGGIRSAETIVFHYRKASSDPQVLQILAHADGIYVAGGDQSNYLRYWQGTPVAAAINAHVAAGKPFGGTSAGLAIQGRYVYGATDGHSLESRTALTDANSSQLTVVSDFLRLEPLWSAGVLTDTHFGRRERQGRLLGMLAKVRRTYPTTPVVGVGVDENTAVAIDGTGMARVYSDTDGRAWIFRPDAQAVPASGPLSVGPWSLVLAGTTSTIDAHTWQVRKPVYTGEVTAREGVISYTPQLPAPIPRKSP